MFLSINSALAGYIRRYPLCCWEGSLVCAEGAKFRPLLGAANPTLDGVPPGKRSEKQHTDLKRLKYHWGSNKGV